MDDQKIRHRMVVAGFLKNKLEEHQYFLSQILEICKTVQKNFELKINPVNTTGKDINFYFSAWTNTLQSLKDSLETIVEKDIPWSRFSSVRHFEFIKNCRNAMTHDGMQIINAYVDGKYYVANDIERFERKSFIRIIPPHEDISTLCIQFSCDLMKEIMSIIEEYEGDIPKGSTLQFEFVARFISNSQLVPQFAKELFAQNRDEIEMALKGVRIDFVEDIKKQILAVQEKAKSYS